MGSGHSYFCKNCGRYFAKKPHPRQTPNYTTRPACPYCGAMKSNIQSAHRYICGNCGRTFKGIYQTKEEPDPIIPSKEVIDLR